MKFVTLAIILLSSSPEIFAKNGDIIPNKYIVVVHEGDESLADSVIDDSLRKAGIDKKKEKLSVESRLKSRHFNGFVATLTPQEVAALRKDERIKSIEQDKVLQLEPMKVSKVTQPPLAPVEPEPAFQYEALGNVVLNYGVASGAQPVPWGVKRVGGPGVPSSSKSVWIIDSGARPSHPELNFDMTRSKSFITGLTSPLDGYGHGTGVAGIIGARDNDIGAVGVAPNAVLVALRVFDDFGRGSLSSAIKAVTHVKTYGKAGDVVNMSLGGGISTTLDNEIKASAAKGILFAIAAGNSAIDCVNNSPARADAPGVYTVSSMNSLDQLSGFSNFGASVDFAAPGEAIFTTAGDSGYSQGGGTSFAAPHVAGILLLHGKVQADGYVLFDKDSKPDPIAHR